LVFRFEGKEKKSAKEKKIKRGPQFSGGQGGNDGGGEREGEMRKKFSFGGDCPHRWRSTTTKEITKGGEEGFLREKALRRPKTGGRSDKKNNFLP